MTIRAAIYSGGPSLEDTWRGGYDLGIAINRAAKVVPLIYWQWLCAGDLLSNPDVFQDYPIPSAGYFTVNPSVLTDLPPRKNDRHLLAWDALPPLPASTSFSITAALHLAAYIGAKTIDVYGHDQHSTLHIPYDDEHSGGKRALAESTEVGRAVSLLDTLPVPVNFIKG